MTNTLQAVATAFRESLPPRGEFSVFDLQGLDRTGIPVVQANMLLSDEPATTGYGYGFTEIESEVGAFGELCEEVHCGNWIAANPGTTASFNEMLRRHGERGVVDPLTLCLSAGSDYTPDLPLVWIEGRRWPSEEPVMVPREWVAAYPYQLGKEPARLITPITNGLGAGLDLYHAIGHGVMEALQRDGNLISYRALDQGVVVEFDEELQPDTQALLDKLKGLGIAVTVKLACTDFGFTNLYVVGDDRGTPTAPVQITACGEASHPDKHRALRKALLEFCGSRARKAGTHGPIEDCRRVMPAEYVDRQIRNAMIEEEEDRALEAMTEWVEQDAAELRRRLSGTVFAERSRVPFSSLPHASPEAMADPVARLNLLSERLAADGLEILYVDLSPAEGPVKVARAIVPGLETETMSYHRVGWRGVRRLRARQDPLILDTRREGAKRVLLRPEDEARAGGPAWFDAALADRIVGDLYPMYRESGPFSAQLLRQRRQGVAA
ncbi:YcaO-like family protein [Roseomonas sp. BN140053]|uniref:YcaO-like family protein n=1 Tax=Roseomonas sp. BN140053 TaxID=3391898 RepID=UPI0039E92030